MNNFFGEDSQAGNEETLQAQDNNDIDNNESVPLENEEEAVEFASEENQDQEYSEEYEQESQEESEVDYQSLLDQKEEEIKKIQTQSQDWVRAMQSSFDKQKTEYQQQLLDLQSKFNDLMANQQNTDQQNLSYDDDEYLTASQVRSLMAQEKKRELNIAEQEKNRLEQARHQEKMRVDQAQQEANNFFFSQPDIDEVKKFYDLHLKNDPFVNQLDYKTQYQYVKSKMNESGAKKNTPRKKVFKKKKLPPTGNYGRSMQTSTSASSFKSLLDQHLKDVVGRNKIF